MCSWYVFALGLYGILKLPIGGVKQKASMDLEAAVLAACLALLQLVYQAAFAAALPSGAARRCICFGRRVRRL